MSLIKNKKGTDKIISVYWFVILFIVAAGVVYMSAVFYGGHYDARSFEEEILIDRVADCLSQHGELVNDWEEISNDNLLEKCNLNFNVEDTDGWEDDQIFVRVSFYDFVNGDETKNSIRAGNVNLEGFCGKGLTCTTRNLYSINGEDQYIIKIKSIVRKIEKNE